MMSINTSLSVSEGLFTAVEREYESTGQLTSDIMKSLYLVHGKTLVAAFDLVDSNKIQMKKSPSGRWLFEIKGSSGILYICLPNSNYCQCPAFKFSVILKREAIMCKHVLAAKLAVAMKQVQVVDVSNEHITETLALMK